MAQCFDLHWAPQSVLLLLVLQNAVSKNATQFKGNAQHDAQEFLLWLLDRVHEDLHTNSRPAIKVSRAALWSRNTSPPTRTPLCQRQVRLLYLCDAERLGNKRVVTSVAVCTAREEGGPVIWVRRRCLLALGRRAGQAARRSALPKAFSSVAVRS